MTLSTTDDRLTHDISPFTLATAYKRLTNLSHSEFYQTFSPLLNISEEQTSDTQRTIPLELDNSNDISITDSNVHADTYLCLNPTELFGVHPEFRHAIETAFLETLVAADSATPTLPKQEHERYRQTLKKSRQS